MKLSPIFSAIAKTAAVVIPPAVTTATTYFMGVDPQTVFLVGWTSTVASGMTTLLNISNKAFENKLISKQEKAAQKNTTSADEWKPHAW